MTYYSSPNLIWSSQFYAEKFQFSRPDKRKVLEKLSYFLFRHILWPTMGTQFVMYKDNTKEFKRTA